LSKNTYSQFEKGVKWPNFTLGATCAVRTRAAPLQTSSFLSPICAKIRVYYPSDVDDES
jgi:hypothetical protein